MNTFHGDVSAGFETVARAFGDAQAASDGGAQLCVYQDGRPVVDIWAGRDTLSDRPYTGDTLTVAMSSTKAVVAVCVHLLAERGLLRYDDPVAAYWPEFAEGGKEHVTVAHLLSHTAGLAAFDPAAGIGARDVLDAARCRNALAQMAPLWQPGKAYLYHFITYGVLLGTVIERVSGRSVGELVKSEIAGPLHLDLWLGLPAAYENRVARHLRANERFTVGGLKATFARLGIDVHGRLMQAMIQTMVTTEDLIDLLGTRAGRAAVIPAANAIGNARAMARMLAACIGPVDGVRLLSATTVDEARTPRTDHLDGPSPLISRTDAPQRFGLGFELERTNLPMGGPGSFGHPGAGGQLVFAHPERGIVAAYLTNLLLWDGVNPDPRWTWMDALQS